MADPLMENEPTEMQAFVQDLSNLPMEIAATLNPANWFTPGYALWKKGDTDAFFALWGDNLATQLALVATLGFQPGWPKEFAYDKILPGVGLSLFVGNVFYSMQAAKVAKRTGNMETCAQPYGVNTPGAMAKTYGIIMPVYAACMLKKLESGEPAYSYLEAADKAWRVACAANFFSGVLELFSAFFAPFLTQAMHPVVLLVPLVGIGLSWLGLGPLTDMVGLHPIVALVPFTVIWASFCSNVQIGRVPMGLLAIALGSVIGWASDFNNYKSTLSASTQHVSFHSGLFGACFSNLDDIWEYIGILIPIALTNALGSLQCVTSAKAAGDTYSPIETMVADGLGSIVGALLGSPYGTTVYIGHPAYKKMGAGRGYSLLNGFLYLIMGFSGLHAVLGAIIPHEAVLGIICFVGLSIASQAVGMCPPRWYPAFFIGSIIGMADWAGTKHYESNAFDATLKYLQNGYLFTSLFFIWGFTTLTDRKFGQSAAIWYAAAVFAFFGLIHAMPKNFGHDAKDGQFTTAYAGMGAVCSCMKIMQDLGIIEACIEEEDPDQATAAVHSQTVRPPAAVEMSYGSREDPDQVSSQS